MRKLVLALLVLAVAMVVLAPHKPGADGAGPHAKISTHAQPPASDTRFLPVTPVTDFTFVFAQPTRETSTDGAPWN